EEIYRANKEEKSVSLTDNHHTQVEQAITLFKQQLEVEKQAERTVVINNSPAEKVANSYLEAIISLQLASKEEQELLLLTKEALNLGRFQKLSKEISKLQKGLKKVSMPSAKQLDAMIAIAKKYPLKESEDKQEPDKTENNNKFVPEIIISESFT
ncbi:MAG: hypothetical protein LBV41_08215, partial [Cytophagaceae bacterium]|nr:hypothetical protein [Cytophagaceae bacterium]